MSENLSRRKALSLLGTALGLALALTEDKAVAETARHPRPHQRRTGQPVTAPPEAATTEFKPTPSISDALMHEHSPQHIGDFESAPNR